MIRTLLNLLLLTALLNGVVHAGANDGMVEWLAPDAKLIGVRQVEFHSVIDNTGKPYDIDVAAKATQALKKKLIEAGISIVGPGEPTPQRIVIQTNLVFYQPGSVGARWVGFGGGAAVCILRTRLIDSNSKRQLADLTGVYQVQAGGLFSVGADKRVPVAAAEHMARRILELVGLGEADYEAD